MNQAAEGGPAGIHLEFRERERESMCFFMSAAAEYARGHSHSEWRITNLFEWIFCGENTLITSRGDAFFSPQKTDKVIWEQGWNKKTESVTCCQDSSFLQHYDFFPLWTSTLLGWVFSGLGIRLNDSNGSESVSPPWNGASDTNIIPPLLPPHAYSRVNEALDSDLHKTSFASKTGRFFPILALDRQIHDHSLESKFCKDEDIVGSWNEREREKYLLRTLLYRETSSANH